MRALLLALLAAGVPATPAAPRPEGRLAVELDGEWREFWRSDAAPAAWTAGHPLLRAALRFRPAQAGLEWAELRISGPGEAWRTGLIVVRIDPARFRFRLAAGVRPGGRGGAWSIERASSAAALALNAGQFGGIRPWGWLVHRGRERQPPGRGPLAPALAVDSAGRVHWVPPGEIAAWRRGRGVAEAIQSYPALLTGNGRVPAALRAPGRGVDLEHRDARLAIGELRDGRLLVVLTRFEGLGGVGGVLPFGLTTPEMAAVMGALGCRIALALDGGISAQLLLREAGGAEHRWPGLRRVPLGLELLPRVSGP